MSTADARRLLTALSSLLLLLAVVLVLVGPLPRADAQQREQRLLQDARDRLSAIGAEIAGAESEAKAASEALAEAEARLREVEAVVNEVAAAVERQRMAVEEAARRLEQVERETAEVERIFLARTADMFKQGPNLPFELVLGATGIEAAVARAGYMRAITQADRVTLETLDAAHVRVAAERARFEEEQARLEQMLAEQKELLAEVEKLRQSRALAAAAAQEEVEALRQEEHDLQAEQKRLEDLIRQRQEEERRRREAEQRRQRAAQQSSSSSGRASRSGHIWPTCGRVSSEFGQRWGRLHAGIDVAAPPGRRISASKAGTVLFVGWQGGYGRLVLIDHHDGVVTAYGHMSAFSTRQGASVDQGDKIGEVGSTGRSTGPHVHFETRVNGSPVNPRQYLSGGPC